MAVLHNLQVLVGAFSLLVSEIATVIWEFILVTVSEMDLNTHVGANFMVTFQHLFNQLFIIDCLVVPQ